MTNPIHILIDRALDHLREKCPDWEVSQPRDFRAHVVEYWKKNLHSRLVDGRVEWSLSLGSRTFRVTAPMFTLLDWQYNPYLSSTLRPPNVRQ